MEAQRYAVALGFQPNTSNPHLGRGTPSREGAGGEEGHRIRLQTRPRPRLGSNPTLKTDDA